MFEKKELFTLGFIERYSNLPENCNLRLLTSLLLIPKKDIFVSLEFGVHIKPFVK